MKVGALLIVIGLAISLTVSAFGTENSTLEFPAKSKDRFLGYIAPSYIGNFTVVQVSNNTPEANEITLARGEDGTFYMGWNDYRSVPWSSGYVHVGFSYSRDGGKTWSTNIVLGNVTDSALHDCAGDPVIITGYGSDCYYLIMEFNASEAHGGSLKHSQLVVKKTSDYGATWDEALIWGYDVDKPWGAFYNGDLYVAWDNVSAGTTCFSRTINGNIHSWTSPVYLPGSNYYPSIDVSEDGTIYIAVVHSSFFSYSMYVYKSTDGGNNFNYYEVGPVGSNSWESDPRSGPIPSLSARGSDVYVVWVSKDTYSQVYLAESHDSGNTWSNEVIPTTYGSNYRYMYPSVSVAPTGVVHISYYRMDENTKKIEVLYRTYENGVFSDEVLVDTWTNNNSFIGDYATIVADDWGNVSIGYTTENPTDNAMFATLSIPIEITDVWNSSVNGTIASGEDLVVNAKITSGSELKNVTLYYRFENDSSYSSTSMNLILGDAFNGTWTANISTVGHSGKLYFYIYADDGRGKSAVSQEYYVDVISTPEILPAVLIALPSIVILRKLRYPSTS